MARPFRPASETQVILVPVPGLRGLKTQVGIVPVEGPAHTMSYGMAELFERALPVFQSVPRYTQLAYLYPPERVSVRHLLPRRRLTLLDLNPYNPYGAWWLLQY